MSAGEPSPIRTDMRWTRGETSGVFAAIALFWAALNWPWLSGALTIPWDAKAHFLPQLQFLAGSFARGDAPFWNPHVFAGHPQVADPQSLIFSPPHLFAALLFDEPGPVVADWVVLLMLLAGALAFAALFRDRAWAPAGAVVAGLVFAFGASAAWRVQHVGQVMSLSYFAIALWLMSRALARRSARWGAGAGVSAGLMLLGRDQVALIGAYTLAGLVLAAWLQGGVLRSVRASLRPLLAMALAAILVAAVPILLTLSLAEQSNRPAIDLAGAGKGSLHPASLLTLVVANLFGAAGPLNDFWGQPSPAWNQHFGDVELFLARNMSVAYLGMVPLLLILGVGVFARRAWDPAIRPVAIASLLILIYALGRYTPLFGLFHQVLPGVSLYRRPADALFNFGAMAALLAGYCAHVLVHSRPDWRSGRRWALTAAIILACGVAGAQLAANLDRFAVARLPLLIATLALILSGGMLLFLRQAHRNAPLGAALLVAATLGIDLAVNNGPSESTGLPTAMYDVLRPDTANPIVGRLKADLANPPAPDRRDRIELAGVDFHWPNASMTHRLDNVLGYNPLRLDAYSRATGAGDHVALPDQRRFAPLMPGYRSLLAEMLGLRFVVTRPGGLEAIDPAAQAQGLREISRTPEAVIYEAPSPLPRALFVREARPVHVENALAMGVWPPGFDPRRNVLLENPPQAQDCPAAQPLAPATDAVRILSYGNGEVRVEVTAGACGYLVLNDSFHRWWTARIQDRQVPVLRANVLFRAVAVPAGRSVVTFEFRPFAGLYRELAAKVPGSVADWTLTTIRTIDRLVAR